MARQEEVDEINDLDYNSQYESPSSDSPLKYRLEDETADSIEKGFEGKSYNEQKGVYEVLKNIKPVMSEGGVQRVMTFFRGVINKTNWQGNIKKDEHNRAMEKYHSFIGEQIAINQAEWGIHENELSFIPGVLELPIFFSTSRSLDNLERESYGGGRTSRRIFQRPRRGGQGFFNNQTTNQDEAFN